MIIIDKTILSEDIADNFFVCNLEKCKGACCVEGDLGAPLEEEELHVMEGIYDKVAPYLTPKGRQAIQQQGTFVHDEQGEYSTPTINGRECAYAVYDEKGILKCGIEQAYQDGKIQFKKPVSCHLYPIRVTRYESYQAVNYDRWDICSPACHFGKALNVPLYKFLKEALVRKFGKAWYKKLLSEIRLRKQAQKKRKPSKNLEI